jgi:hypothetical protein
VARKVPELCKAYTPGKPDQDIHLRLARLEHIIDIALPQYASGSGFLCKDNWSRERARSLSPSADADTHSQADEDDIGSGTFQSGKWYGTSASGSVAPASVLQQVGVDDSTSPPFFFFERILHLAPERRTYYASRLFHVLALQLGRW